MAKRNDYPKAVVDYIKQNVVNTAYKDLTTELNTKFGTNYTVDAIKRFVVKKLGLTNYVNKWSEEEKQYLRENVVGKSYSQLAIEVSKIKGVKRTEVNTRNQCLYLGLHNGIDTVFRDGHEAYGKYEIGAERKQGRKTYIKVSDNHRITKENPHGADRNFRLKNEYLWEQTHGEIPKNCHIIFADGNRENFELDNLVCIPIAVKTQMNALGWQFLDNELLRKTAIRSCLLDWYLRQEVK